MFSDLLYQLTPRDSQSLLLEIRSIDKLLQIPAGSVAGALKLDFAIPRDRIGLILSAGVAMVPNVGFAQTFNGLGIHILDANDVPRSYIANKHENLITPVAANESLFGFWVGPNSLLMPEEQLSFFWSFTVAAGGTVDVRPRVRMLLMPRGNIGV